MDPILGTITGSLKMSEDVTSYSLFLRKIPSIYLRNSELKRKKRVVSITVLLKWFFIHPQDESVA